MSDQDQAGISRRSLIKRGAIVGGAAVWATPVITSFTSPAGAQTAPGSCIGCITTTGGQPGTKCTINDPAAAQAYCTCLDGAGNDIIAIARCILALPPGSTTCTPCGHGGGEPACACP